MWWTSQHLVASSVPGRSVEQFWGLYMSFPGPTRGGDSLLATQPDHTRSPGGTVPLMEPQQMLLKDRWPLGVGEGQPASGVPLPAPPIGKPVGHVLGGKMCLM